MVDQRLQVVAHGAERAGADVERLPGDRRVETARDGVDEVLDREELVEVVAVAEDRDAAALADPVEQDLEHAEPLRADERLRPHDDDVEPAAPESPASCSASIFDSPYQPTPTSGSSS